MCNVDHVGDIGEGHIVIAFYEHHLFRARLEDIGQSTLKVFPSSVFLVDFYRRSLASTAVDQLHHDGPVGLIVLGCVGRRWLGHQCIEPFRGQWRDHHEDDEQDE